VFGGGTTEPEAALVQSLAAGHCMTGLRRVMFKRRGRLLFVNKKKQKNFFKPGRAGFAVTGPAKQKFFAPLFFKKAASFLFQAEPIRL
jgi:hypothetical protein